MSFLWIKVSAVFVLGFRVVVAERLPIPAASYIHHFVFWGWRYLCIKLPGIFLHCPFRNFPSHLLKKSYHVLKITRCLPYHLIHIMLSVATIVSIASQLIRITGSI